MSNVLKLNFSREAHVKKYTKLMKLDLPAELERLRYVYVRVCARILWYAF